MVNRLLQFTALFLGYLLFKTRVQRLFKLAIILSLLITNFQYFSIANPSFVPPISSSRRQKTLKFLETDVVMNDFIPNFVPSILPGRNFY